MNDEWSVTSSDEEEMGELAVNSSSSSSGGGGGGESKYKTLTLEDVEKVEDFYALHKAIEGKNFEKFKRILGSHVHSAAVLSSSSSLKEEEDEDEEEIEILRRRDEWGQQPIHTAIFAMDLACFTEIVTASNVKSANTTLRSKLTGSPLIHVILSIAGLNSSEAETFSLQALEVLKERCSAPLLRTLMLSFDEYSRSALHVAFDLELPRAHVDWILRAAAKAFTQQQQQDEAKETPGIATLKRSFFFAQERIYRQTFLHSMCASVSFLSSRLTGSDGVMEEVKRAVGGGEKEWNELSTTLDVYGRTPVHLIASLIATESELETQLKAHFPPLVLKMRDCLNRTPLEAVRCRGGAGRGRDVLLPTAVITHEACMHHFTCPPSKTRVPNFPTSSKGSSMMSSSIPPENVNRLTVLFDEKLGILKSRKLTAGVSVYGTNEKRTKMEAPEVEIGDLIRVHEWPYVEFLSRKCGELKEDDDLLEIDADTSISKGTYKAALRAAGAPCLAVDEMMAGRIRNAFCAVRPPGHHAGTSGLVKECGSYGFCFFNNVAVAGAYAMSRYRDRIKRIAIVDFDVHHGNGTEQCLECLRPRRVVTATLKSDFTDPIEIVTPVFKPWVGNEDANNVLFCSVHGYGPKGEGGGGFSFYPGSGRTNVAPAVPSGGEEAEGASTSSDFTKDRIVDVGQSTKSRMDWRAHWRDYVLPRVCAFSPDLILVSAGFDAHAKDEINFGLCSVYEHDYVWLTEALTEIAEECCEGRIVSVLEGGYKIQGRTVSAFARSVHEHACALSRPPRKDSRRLMEWERLNPLSSSSSSATTTSFSNLTEGAGGAGEEEGRRPRRRAAANIDFVKLNEEIERAKRMKASEGAA